MGTLTLSQMRSELTSYLGNRDDITDARLTRFINMAQDRVGRTHDFEALEALDTSVSTTYTPADSDRFVTPPTGTKKIRSVIVLNDSRSRKLVYRSPRAFDNLVAEPEYYSKDIPTYYTKFQSKLELFRLPDAAYNMRFRIAKWATSFSEDGSDDSNTSDYDGIDDIIIMLSAIIAWNSLGEVGKGKEIWPIYASLINDAVGEDVERPDLDRLPNPGVIGRGPMVGDYWKNPWVFTVEEDF